MLRLPKLLALILLVTAAPVQAQQDRGGMSLAPSLVQSQGTPSLRPAAGGSAGFTCSGKRVCREMASCAEAVFNLRQCGASQLDRDRDGIPCESICR